VNLASSWGFDQGYDEYHYLAPSYLAGATESSSKLILYQLYRQVYFKLKSGITFDGFYQDSRVVNAVAFDWLERFKDDRFFLFLHYMDVHDPYFEHPYDGRGIARVSSKWPDAHQAEEMKRLYRGEIEYLDEAVGDLIAHLESLGVWDDTLVVLTADHGEEFYEHEGWWHGLTLYEEQIHVPLLLKPAAGQTLPADTRMARLIDVVPTLIEVAGAEPTERMQGVSLYVGEADRAAKDRQHFAEEDHEGNVLFSLTDEQMNKLIVANPGNHRKLPETSYFELSSDPHERHNLADAHAARVAQLRDLADLQRRAAAGEAVESGGDVEMTLEECMQLMNLGYVENCDHLH
jgi:arylsulfatase A-like enzyme